MCYACGYQFEPEAIVSRSAVCPECGADIRVCKNCLFYAPGLHWDCRETVPEQVVDKERANFCDYFRLNLQSTHVESGRQEKRTKARDDFNNLFS